MDVINRVKANIESFDNSSLLVRYILAASVFYSHMFAIYGLPEPSLLWGIHSLGWYAVNCFFLLSGILVSQSFHKNNIRIYFISRFLRVLPAYILAVTFSICLALIFVKPMTIGVLFKSIYLFFSNFLPISKNTLGISGAWIYSSLPGELNMSLWTIPYEVFCYVFIIPLFLTKKNIKIKIIIFFISVFFLFRLGVLNEGFHKDLFRVFLYFIIGMCTYRFLFLGNTIKLDSFIVTFCSILLYFVDVNILELLLNILIVFLVLLASFYFTNFLNLNKDMSYGIYLYAFPISQMMTVLIENIYYGMLLASMILVITSYFSYVVIEKPCLNFKKIIINKDIN